MVLLPRPLAETLMTSLRVAHAVTLGGREPTQNHRERHQDSDTIRE